MNHNGICLSQKQEPRLCLIQPFIDLQQRIMVIKAQGLKTGFIFTKQLSRVTFLLIGK